MQPYNDSSGISVKKMNILIFVYLLEGLIMGKDLLASKNGHCSTTRTSGNMKYNQLLKGFMGTI